MTTLSMENTTFYSQGDEANLFSALRAHKHIADVFGEGSSVRIVISSGIMDADAFLTIYSILKRYNADCTQLSSLRKIMNEEDWEYISSSKMLWHLDIFGR